MKKYPIYALFCLSVALITSCTSGCVTLSSSEVSKNRLFSINEFESMINGEERKKIYRAPSKGLYLKKIYYD